MNGCEAGPTPIFNLDRLLESWWIDIESSDNVYLEYNHGIHRYVSFCKLASSES